MRRFKRALLHVFLLAAFAMPAAAFGQGAGQRDGWWGGGAKAQLPHGFETEKAQYRFRGYYGRSFYRPYRYYRPYYRPYHYRPYYRPYFRSYHYYW